MRAMTRAFFWFAACAGCAGCGDGTSGGGGDAGTDADADSDADSDADTDADTDADSDADSDTDSDTDADSDADSDADCATLSGADGEVFATEYDVGPGQELESPNDVPWESLAPGTLVRIHYRETPYAAKWVLNTVATAGSPVVVRGVMDGADRPIITGDGAETRPELSYWNEGRSVIKVGGSNLPSDDLVPAYIRIENLEIRSARPGYTFTDADGAVQEYSENAAAVHVEIGEHITIHNCVLSDSGNGLFTGHGSADVLVTGNYVHDNGIEGSIYEHNSYTESFGIVFQYNRYGPLRAGCGGNNLKDRSAGTVIRNNWIESGNRQLDLVESDYDDFVGDPSYAETFVYGNVLVEPADEEGNSQIVHYGGDGDDTSMYRTGTLFFYANTVVSMRDGNTTLFRIAANDATVDARDNVFFPSAGGEYLAICAGTGNVLLADDWLPSGWVETHEDSLDGAITDDGNVEGDDPGLSDPSALDFSLAEGSPCIGAAGPIADGAPAVSCSYALHQQAAGRPDDGAPDIGAFEN